MNVILNDPHKPKNQMSKRQRYQQYTDEVNYAINIIMNRFIEISRDVPGVPMPKIYVVLTTPEKQRKTLAYHLNAYIPYVRVVVGRTSIYDSIEESKRKICSLSSYSMWELWKDEIEDLLESFTVLIDAKTFIETPKGKHGQYCRWTQPLESDLTLVIKTITGRYGVKDA